MISGPKECGKTSFCVRLLVNIYRLCTVPEFQYIMWCSSEDSAVPREKFADALRRIICHSGIPNFEEKGSDGPRLVVLDDLLNEAYSGTCAVSSTRAVITGT